MMSVTRRMLATISSIVAPAWSTSALPVLTLSTESSIKPLIPWRQPQSAAPGCAPRWPPRQSHGPARRHGPLRRRVQRQNVGLEGNAVDHADNVGDLLRRFIDRAHRAHHLRHHGATLAGHVRGGHGQRVRLARIVRILTYGEVSSSRLDAVSLSDDACCSVRTDRSALPAEICAAATLTVSAERARWRSRRRCARGTC